MRILVVDDHPMFREGLRAALETMPNIESIEEAGTVAEALLAAATFAPDIVLMDLALPDGSGIDATRAIRERDPSIGVVVLTMSADDDAVMRSLAAGARGYLLKGSDRATILDALAAVSRGDAIIGAGVAEGVLNRVANPSARPTPLPILSDREREVLGLVAQGLTNQAIAGRLFLSTKTVRNHVSNILTKLAVSNRREAAAAAREAGI